MLSEIRALARQFAQKELSPIVEQDEHDGKFRPEKIKALGDLGLAGVTTPEELGGAGLGSQEYAAVVEEIGAASASYAISTAVSGLPQMILTTFGNDAQKKKYVPPLASGQAIGSFSLSEISSGSDAGNLKTQAKKSGKNYILNGTKHWCTQADSASTLIVFARTGEPGPRGISAFIVEKDTPGLTMGKREKKMGCHISHTMEVLLQNVQIPAENLIGKEGEGFKIALKALDSGRITISASALGVARSALEVAVRYSKERQQFGKPISDFQGISFMLADMATQLFAARHLVQDAARRKDEGKPYTMQAAMAKVYATDAAMQITTDAVQILGGAGYTQDFPLERYMREAKVLQIVEGTNQIQRIVIGRHLVEKEGLDQ